MGVVKSSVRHKFGNVIGGLCCIVDGLVLVFTIGNYNSRIQLKWNMHRRTTGLVGDIKVGE